MIEFNLTTYTFLIRRPVGNIIHLLVSVEEEMWWCTRLRGLWYCIRGERTAGTSRSEFAENRI